MEPFEIHITGKDRSILPYLEAMKIKHISVDLLKPDGEVLRTEHMSSFVQKAPNIDLCQLFVSHLVWALKYSTEIVRVKIECPPYEHYIHQCLYAESHFKVKEVEGIYPISRNQRSGKLMGTDRLYYSGTKDIDELKSFINYWKGKEAETEFCLYDSFVNEDKDWFELYGE